MLKPWCFYIVAWTACLKKCKGRLSKFGRILRGALQADEAIFSSKT